MKFRENSSFFGRLFLNRTFARVSPVFASAALALSLAPISLSASGNTAEPTRQTVKRDAADVQDSLLAVAELRTEMGDRFGRNYYQQAVESYQFLLREYPKSKFSQDIYLRTAKLQQDKLGDTAAAMKTYQEFLKRFPRSAQKREVQEALAELSLLQNSNAPETKSAANVRPVAPEKQEPVRTAQTEVKKDSRSDDDEDAQ